MVLALRIADGGVKNSPAGTVRDPFGPSSTKVAP